MTDFALTRQPDLTGVGHEMGTATTVKTGSTAGFNIRGTVVTAQVARDLTIAVGDVCILAKFGALWTVVQRLYSGAPADPGNPTLPDPQPSTYTGVSVLTALETRSWKDGVRRDVDDDVYQGDSGTGLYVGAAFFGEMFYALDGAMITGASVRLRRGKWGGAPTAQPLTLWLVEEDNAISANPPTLLDSAAGPSLAWGGRSDFGIPTSWIEDLAAGAAGGLAVYDADGSPYLRLEGRGTTPSSFTVTVYWSR